MSTLASFIQDNENIRGLLEDLRPLTFFAPSDSAFEGQNIDPTMREDLILNHMFGGLIFFDSMADG